MTGCAPRLVVVVPERGRSLAVTARTLDVVIQQAAVTGGLELLNLGQGLVVLGPPGVCRSPQPVDLGQQVVTLSHHREVSRVLVMAYALGSQQVGVPRGMCSLSTLGPPGVIPLVVGAEVVGARDAQRTILAVAVGRLHRLPDRVYVQGGLPVAGAEPSRTVVVGVHSGR